MGEIKIAEPSIPFNDYQTHNQKSDEVMGSIYIATPRQNGQSITSARNLHETLSVFGNQLNLYANTAVDNLKRALKI